MGGVSNKVNRYRSLFFFFRQERGEIEKKKVKRKRCMDKTQKEHVRQSAWSKDSLKKRGIKSRRAWRRPLALVLVSKCWKKAASYGRADCGGKRVATLKIP